MTNDLSDSKRLHVDYVFYERNWHITAYTAWEIKISFHVILKETNSSSGKKYYLQLHKKLNKWN